MASPANGMDIWSFGVGKQPCTRHKSLVPPADVDEERVHDGINVVGLGDPGIVSITERGEEGLGNPEDAVENALHGATDVVARLLVGVGGNTDDGANLGVATGIGQRPDMLEKIPGGFGLGDDALGQRCDQLDVEHARHRVFAEKNAPVAGDDSVDDAVLHVTDNRRHDLAHGDVGGPGGAGEHAGLVGPEIEPGQNCFLGGRAAGGRRCGWLGRRGDSADNGFS